MYYVCFVFAIFVSSYVQDRFVSKNLLANCFRNFSQIYGYYHQIKKAIATCLGKLGLVWKQHFGTCQKNLISNTTLYRAPWKVLISKTTLCLAPEPTDAAGQAKKNIQSFSNRWRLALALLFDLKSGCRRKPGKMLKMLTEGGQQNKFILTS